MDAKLTLSIDKEIVERAKEYARTKNTSLSNLIENYLASVTGDPASMGSDITPLVKRLSGVLDLAAGEDKQGYYNYLKKKYA